MALLATHPEEQEELYKELKSVMDDRGIPVSNARLSTPRLTSSRNMRTA